MALHDLDDIGWFRLERLARAALPEVMPGRKPRRGAIGRHAGGTGHGPPLPPSRRLPPAHMGRASFLLLVGAWLAAVAVILALVLAVRWLT